MGACFHIAGVYCDNCRTGMSGSVLRPLTGAPLTGDLAGSYPPPLATAASLDALRAEVAALRARVEALETDMATIQRLAEAGLNDESVSEICALDDIYSVTKGLPLDEEG